MASITRAKKAKQLKSLHIKRAHLLDSAQMISEFNDHYDDSQASEVAFRLERLDKLWEELEKVENEIDVTHDGNPISSETRSEFQNLYFRLKGSLSSKIVSSPPTPPPVNTVSVPFHGVRLPEIKIPDFGGKAEDWTAFHDLFVSMIHENHQLSDIQKLHYLRASLKGDASRIILSLPITSNSYAVAWKLLTDRYEDKNLLIKQHIEALFAIAPRRKESAEGLSELADEFEKHVKILDTLETKAQHWDSVLVELLFSRMDAISQREWENHRDKSQRPSYEDLLAFIHEYARTLQSLKLSQSPFQLTESRIQKPRTISNHSAADQLPKCAVCKQSHYLFQCEQFRGQSPQQRFDLVKKNKLCINCIKSTHFAKNCTSGCCKYCSKKHHTLLHLAPTPSLVTTEAPPHNSNDLSCATYQLQPQQAKTSVNTLSHSPSRSKIRDSAVASVDRISPLTSPPVYAPCLSTSGLVTPPSTSCQTATPNLNSDKQCTVLLFTALVKVQDKLGQFHFARALLDSGSQSSFMSESLCQRLSLCRKKVNMPVTGIGQSVVSVRYTAIVNISSRLDAQSLNSTHSIECLVLPKLTVNLPTRTVDVSTWKLPPNLQLADPQFNICHGIDLILGAELFSVILQAEQIKFDDKLPVLQKSSLGYLIAGKVPTPLNTTTTCLVSTLETIDSQLQRFWEVENFDNGKALTTEEQLCETHFAKTHSRDRSGRYIVRLPVRKEMLPMIGDTKSSAVHRFTAMEKRFRLDQTLRSSYVQFMEEYRALGHMEEVLTRVAMPQCFLPHHAIHRPESSTTKTRVVFDGSAKSTNQISLNDVLLTGPTVQPSLLSIVLNFRKHRYVVTADIEKMYRQVLVHPDDRPLQQILWRKQENEPLTTYQLKTVTYGTSCAPFLATRVLNQLVNDEGKDFPLAGPIVTTTFYVDDLLTGADDLDTLVQICQQMEGLLERAKLSLRKWSANHPQILSHIPKDRIETQPTLELDQSPSIKTLGLLWYPAEDFFGFKIPQFPALKRVTKRIALSEMSQLFEPLGLIGPVVASAKMFVQQLWLEKLNWDDELPEHLQIWWLSFRASIDVIKCLRVPRWVLCPLVTDHQLHCFVDASEKGYGSCIYVVSSNSCNILTSNLLIAKSRVAPVSGLSMPRLELCAALLGSQLIDSVLKTTHYSNNVMFWSDSTIVLYWILSPSKSWRVFVSNRIAEIQRLTHGHQWRHVSSELNPADRISRGAEATQLVNDTLWWHGPPFLVQDCHTWPDFNIVLTPSIIEQQTVESKQTVALFSSQFDDSLILKHSELARLLRITAYCYRFFHNCKATQQARTVGSLTHWEYDNALKSLIRLAQQIVYSKEIQYLDQREPSKTTLRNAPFKSPLKTIDVMLDPTGLLRFDGRLANLAASFDSRFPIILPADHHLSRLIARSIHHQTLHAGPTQLLATIRQRFWPIRGRLLVRRTVNHCITCFRCRPKLSTQFMAPLPVSRIKPAKVFETTGLDYCGPFYVRPLVGRGASVKVWVAVYVCFAVKAVVLDIVVGLSTAACVNSLRRFVSRVGRVRTIHCDNGTAFVGASREIKEMRQQYIQQFKDVSWTNECLEKGIDFKFIPPRAPHFGGLWEAAVKSFKYHLVRIMGSSPYQFDAFRTTIAQAESILNSRPLTPLSNNPDDLSALTPAHFLIGESSFHLPEPDQTQIPTNRLSHFQTAQRSLNDLWKRWSNEYVSLLHQRPSKWQKDPTMFSVGALVLIKNDNSPPRRWPLGRIIAVYPGGDDIVRVVDVRTEHGVRRRATSELCLLPIDDDTRHTDDNNSNPFVNHNEN